MNKIFKLKSKLTVFQELYNSSRVNAFHFICLILLGFFIGLTILFSTQNQFSFLLIFLLLVSLWLIIFSPEIMIGLYASGFVFTILILSGYNVGISTTGKWALVPFAAVLFGVINIMREKKTIPFFRITQIAFPLMLFGALLYLGNLYAPASSEMQIFSTLKAYQFGYSSLFLFIAPLVFINATKKLSNLFAFFLIGSFLLGLVPFMFFQKGVELAPSIPGILASSIGTGRVTGFTALSIITFAILFIPKNFLKFFTLFLSLPFLFLMFYSGNRGALVSFVLSLAFLLFILAKKEGTFTFKNLFNIIFLLITFSIILFVLKNIIPDNLKRYETLFSPSFLSGSDRMPLFKDAVRLFLSSPLIGRGTGAFYIITGNNYPHNIFLEIASDLGIAGLSIFLFILYKIFCGMQKLIFLLPNISNVFFKYSIVLAMTGFIFYFTAAQFSLSLNQNSIIWFFAGYILVVYEGVRYGKHRSSYA